MASGPTPGVSRIQNAILAYISVIKRHQAEMKARQDEPFDAATFRLPGQTTYNALVLPDFVTKATIERFKSLEMRHGDIIVAAYPKSGSMLAAELVWLTLNSGDTELARKIPNILRCPHMEREDGMVPSHDIAQKMPPPRLMKTHLPVEYLPAGFEKVVYVMRNPKDTLVSCYHFYEDMPEFGFKHSWEDFFTLVLADNIHYGNYFDHVLGYWGYKDDPRFLFVEYENLVRHKAEEIARIEQFCGRSLTEEARQKICQVTSLEAMKGNPQTNFSMLLNNPAVQAEVPEFLNWNFYRKGEPGDWKNYLSADETDIIDEMIRVKLESAGLHLQYQ